MQLLFPGFLWAGLGIGLPVLVHLLQLRRPKRVLFSNTAFVREVELKSGRRRIQDWLVLALRVLAVGLLVLAFCQPYLPAVKANIVGEDVAVVLDNSPSVQAQAADGGTVWQNELSRAGTLGHVYSGDARFRLPGQRGGRLTATTYGKALVEISDGNNGLGWGNGELQRAWLAPQGGPVYLVSDFQKNEVGAETLRRLSGEREVILMPQVAKTSGNLYVDSVWLNDAFVRAQASVGLHIQLHNGGGRAVVDEAVKVQLMGQQVAAYRASIAVGGTLETVVQVQLPEGAALAGEVRLDDAGPRFDNVFYFVLSPTASVQVVEIGSEPVAQGAYRREALFQYTFYRPQQVDFGKLQQANLVLLSGPAEISVGVRQALAGVVRRGGSVAVVPAESEATHEAYAQLLKELGVGAVQWQGGAPVKQELRMPNLQSPFFREVFGAQPRQVALPEASPVLQLPGGGTDVLRLRDGGAFLTEFREGAGKVYVFTAPFASAYTDFTKQALFVPVLYRLALLSYRDDQPLAYRVGAGALTLTVPPARATGVGEATGYRLVRDSLTLVPGQRQVGRQVRLEVPAQLTTPGFYQVRRQGQAVATLAFNYPRRESELAAYSVAELRQLIGPDRPNVQVIEPGGQVQALAQLRAGQSGQPLWRYCLLAALACLLAEELVLRLGRRAALAV